MISIAVLGNVDDGKSTLLGRLFLDSGQIASDLKMTDLSFLTDGLSYERENKVTVDVAYRHFSTNKNRFLLIDCPGHFVWIKNLVCGLSKSDYACLVIDGERGVSAQTIRHLKLCNFFKIKKVLIVINKMDQVNYSEAKFQYLKKEIQKEYRRATCIPVSALKGDNVVKKSNKMSWYEGGTLLSEFDKLAKFTEPQKKDKSLSIAIQCVTGINHHGDVLSGSVKRGDLVRDVLSSRKLRIKNIYLRGTQVNKAKKGDSVTLTFENEVSLLRGSVLVKMKEKVSLSNSRYVKLLWLCEVNQKKRYQINIQYRTFMAEICSKKLKLNEISSAKLRFEEPILNETSDDFFNNFILIDPKSCETVAVGLLH